MFLDIWDTPLRPLRLEEWIASLKDSQNGIQSRMSPLKCQIFLSADSVLRWSPGWLFLSFVCLDCGLLLEDSEEPSLSVILLLLPFLSFLIFSWSHALHFSSFSWRRLFSSLSFSSSRPLLVFQLDDFSGGCDVFLRLNYCLLFCVLNFLWTPERKQFGKNPPTMRILTIVMKTDIKPSRIIDPQKKLSIQQPVPNKTTKKIFF